MDELVEIINQLQDVFALTGGSPGIDLPQIVVVGAQSSGKSSVLEHIVGKSFLPRGVGIVTRCPLILQLVHSIEEYAIINQNFDNKFTDFSLIQNEIEKHTDKIAGKNKGICAIPIFVRLYSPNFLNLTLVDLPGLTKLPVGDQPTDIEEQCKKLVMKYIENPNSIILAVMAANVDMATSESLKISKEVDPEGLRTLAVITKLDLMDDGTDAWDMLSGKVIPVKRGIVGVVNRSQKDIQDEKSVEKSLEDEALFFETHYKSIASQNGCKYLVKKVQTILVSHIKNKMPELKEKIRDKLMSKNEELDQIKENKLDNQTVLLLLLTKFSKLFISTIKGNLTDEQTGGLQGGAVINKIYQDRLSTSLNIDALHGLSKSYIISAMENSSGIDPAIFVPEVAFRMLTRKQIEKLRNPCLYCVNMVHKELNKIIQICIDDTDLGLEVYPKLICDLEKVVADMIQSQIPKTNEMVHDFFNVQLSLINTSHPDFLSNSDGSMSELFTVKEKVKSKPDNNAFSRILSQELNVTGENTPKSKYYDLMVKLITSYFAIVKKTVQDMVPKIIRHFLVNHIMDNIHKELIHWMMNSDADELLKVLDEVTERRKELKKEIAVLERANEIVNNISSAARAQCNV